MEENENARLEALYNYEIINSGQERGFDRLTEIASLICECEISLISFAEKDRLWYKSATGLAIEEVPRGFAICEYALLGEGVFIVEDTLEDERFRHHALSEDGVKVRFYAGYPLIDPNGFTLGSICVADLAPKKLTAKQQRILSLLAEEAISLIIERRKKEEYKNFSILFNDSEDLICILSPDGKFKKANPGFKKRLGFNESELMQKTIFDFIPPEDLENATMVWKNLKTGQPSDEPTHTMLTKDGQHKIIEWTATPEKSNGNLFAIGRDVTREVEKNRALRVSEQKFKAFFESSQGLMCTHDLDGNFISLNSAGAKILGFRRTELRDKSLFDIVPIERHNNLRQYLTEIVQHGHSKGYMVVKRKSGEQRIWLYSNVLQKDLDNKPYIVGNAVDITDQKKLENELIHTRNLLEETSKLAKIGGWELNLNEGKVVWTATTREVHGVPKDFIPTLDNALNFYKNGESREKIQLAIEECLQSGKDWDLELEITDFNGREIWVRAKGHAESPATAANRIYGTLQNIDDQKRAELALMESKKLLDDVLSASTEVSIIATDNEGIITVFNRASEHLLEYSAAEMIGKQTPEILHDKQEVEELCTSFSSTLGYEVKGFEVFKRCADSPQKERPFTFITKSGKRLRVSLSITSIKDTEGEIIGYLGISTDITQKEETETALAREKAILLAFIENAPASVAMVDKDMYFLAASRKWIKDYTQISSNIEGLWYYDVFPNLSEERIANHKEVLSGKIIKKEEDIYIDVRSNTPHQIAWEMRPWHQLDGSIGGMMIFTQDISIAVQHREEMTIAKLRADHANAAKSEFLANMSHEIRTPLNGVIGFTDLVLKTQLNETQKQYLTIVNQSANSLLSIINDILDFSKIEAGKFELDIEKCDLYDIAWQASDITTYQIQAKNLEMLLNLPPDLPRFVWTDALRLKQVLINLLGNAAKFTTKGEIELKIESLGREDEHHSYRFSVRDTGIGIAKSKQAKIFGAFSQEDSSTTKKYGGTGLGLTISNKLLKMMGSHLELKSSPGEGSTFFFDLKLKSEEGEPIEWRGIESITNVLVVDDNDNNRAILVNMLSLKNIQADQARNGFEALQFLAEGRVFDAILMDYHMQYMDGLETSAKIRESFTLDQENLPLILLHSSSDDEKIIRACRELQIDHRLLKPIKMHELYRVLSRLKTNEVATDHSEQIVLADENDGYQYKFMVVEDNEVNRFLARALLEKIHPQSVILEAENGLVALEIFQRESPDLVFMDIQMPEMNGYECTAKIRQVENGKRTPIIALTAANVMGEREKSLAAGMDDFITKPVLEENIESILKKWLLGVEKPETQISKIIKPVHFDSKKLESYLDNDVKKMEKIIRITLIQLNQAFSQLNKKLTPLDYDMILSLSHKLYGMASSAGLNNLAQISSGIQEFNITDGVSLKAGAELMKNEIEILIPLLKQTYAIE
ncbi:PAS domain S-box protein [Pedobacter psychrodurus]|uniref:PAS domain S-box protein n=1 Tax=Pedobacter psychrodurus TaxID=2530456 RepID=UPI00292E8A77|nr:PAS domain S-box protein [Pedobacter psychrodurus]